MSLPSAGSVKDPDVQRNLEKIRESFPLTADKLANDSVGAAQIAAGAIGTSEAPTFVNSTVENMKVLRGIVTLAGGTASVVKGSGFTVNRNAAGDVTITFTAAFSDIPAVTVTADFNVASGVVAFFAGTAPTASAVRVAIVNTAFANVDGRIHFIAIGPR